ncbi:MAG TPA: sodium ion-translocating decarboxylase subunit beta [Mesotoga infera]|jgi:oxaloacetate decarboxylase beta subunit|uniref:Glutaconyl-CoA decarboxylase subunit beta n=1 Tax=Mesotoga infera TaxID=1236046 RepID=A0A7Z7PP20_9BACT|nr:sodium ion-translocating decarboxylase subunit beta [Mesotoga infera]MBP8660147.1 sodium ion-translocating decarboxylase subunit beta [Mesotoga sp.]NLI07302.1 sodium ion-translocating decarboxylase subunit beta [Thermotogaceae bacterium]SSC13599.1 Glutaconyl-CoA decarboxylase subunit beta [Mesotoga infera]HNR78622.1 sodium ion-translocating decarboxylase subunit beta [Mesotoga infera]HOI34351.1 sodium ion-translocating decarboxylase subunit beta [Mesotoga infera]
MAELISGYFAQSGFATLSWENVVMFAIASLLLYLAVAKDAEPLLLIPIAFGMIIANIPPQVTGVFEPGTGFMWILQQGLVLGIYPPLIFLGIGAVTDFSFVLANPKTLFLGAAAQIGIFVTFIAANLLGFSLLDAAAISIIGGADGPTSIYVASILKSQYLPVIAIASYSYIALVPIIQPPVMKLLTTKKERRIVMGKQLRKVSKLERIVFPVVSTIAISIIVPQSLPLIGMLMLGNLLRENGRTKRLVEASGKYISDTVIILLCVSVGAKADGKIFLSVESIMVMVLGCAAFIVATASGVLFAKLMNLFSTNKVNPLIGAAGVSAVPTAARVAQKVASEEDGTNFILMHAMGPNIAGVIGSAVAAGVFLSIIK